MGAVFSEPIAPLSLHQEVSPSLIQEQTTISKIKRPEVETPNEGLLMYTYIVPALHFLQGKNSIFSDQQYSVISENTSADRTGSFTTNGYKYSPSYLLPTGMETLLACRLLVK